jgi:hypothetical protein
MKSEHLITILFDAPFWVALFERTEKGEYAVARVVISTSEPESVEIVDFLDNLDFEKLQYTKPIATEKVRKEKISFKKQQKLAKKATTAGTVNYVYSKAQMLLKEQFEVNKKTKKIVTKQQKEEIDQRKFDIRQQKNKEKHKGH